MDGLYRERVPLFPLPIPSEGDEMFFAIGDKHIYIKYLVEHRVEWAEAELFNSGVECGWILERGRVSMGRLPCLESLRRVSIEQLMVTLVW